MTAKTQRLIQRRTIKNATLGDLPPVLSAIYAARGVTRTAELDLGLEKLIPPAKLSGIDDAVALLIDIFNAQARVVIIGDFDADGATSCAVGTLALRRMGLRDVHYLVPNRFEYGYGLTPEIVAVAAEHLQPDLIITVDNGIASHDGVKLAREFGISVLITDHHLPGDVVPQADVILNPNQAKDTFPSKSLAGVGVVFYLMIALRAGLRDSGWFTEQGLTPPNLAELLDLVALGTVADLVPLDYNNRILVAQGLARIRAGKCRPGIRALLDCAKRSLPNLAASDLGYAVAPRLNAAGRLEDMSLGIECLLTDDPDHARRLAAELDQLNQQRRTIEAEMQEQAARLIVELDDLDAGICLFDAHWHQGVVGLLASRVKDQTNRPTIVFAPGDNDELKGSARSIAGLHIRDLLDRIATLHPDVLQKFGGHAMAAGLSLARDKLDQFKQLFSEHVKEQLGDQEVQNVVVSDGILSEQDMDLPLAELIRTSGPWGQGFPEPLFDDVFEIVDQSIVGEVHLKMRVRKQGHTRIFDAIAFGHLRSQEAPRNGDTVQMAYRLDVNEFQGLRTAQLIIEHLLPC